jgi:hypothetical protein
MVRQVQEALQDQLRIGESRHDAKLAEATEKISDGTASRNGVLCLSVVDAGTIGNG